MFATLFRCKAAILMLGLASGVVSSQEDPEKAFLQRMTAAADKSRGEIQKKLAASDDKLLVRLRIDGFTTGKKHLIVRGVFLNPGAPAGNPEKSADEKKAAPPSPNEKADGGAAKEPEKAVEPDERNRFNEEIQNRLTVLLQNHLGDKEGALLLDMQEIFRDAIPRDKHPHVVLQRSAQTSGIDRLKLDGCRFGPDGRLVLSGWRGKDEAERKWLAEAVEKDLNGETKPVPPPPGLPKLAVDLSTVEAVDWQLTPARVQAAFAQSDVPALRRSRIDRLMMKQKFGKRDPKTDEDMNWEVVVVGLKVGPEDLNDQQILDVLGRTWPALFESKPTVLSNTALLLDPKRQAPDPAAAIQKAVAARPALDGVRIDPGARFDKDGALLLTGLQPGLDDAGRRAVLECTKDLPPAARGVVLDGLAVLPTQRILKDLRAWAAEAADDAKLERLLFDDKGELKLVGTVVDDQTEAKIAARLRELLKDLPKELRDRVSLPAGSASTAKRQGEAFVSRLEPPVEGRAKAEEPAPAGVRVKLGRFGQGLTAHLRRLVAADPENWHGVEIERGFFTPNDRYALRGAVDERGQNDKLNRLLAEYRAAGQWKEFLAAEPVPIDLAELPLPILLERLGRVVPTFPELDGLAIETAAYDPEARLILTGSAVGESNRDLAEKRLISLFELSPKWRIRAARGLRFQSGAEVPINSAIATLTPFAIRDALANADCADRATRSLEQAAAMLPVALRHARGDSGLWFLSAYYHRLSGDSDLVRRDLYRVILAEGDEFGPDNATRSSRYEIAMRLQGPLRTELENQIEVLRRLVRDGRWTTVLAP